MLRRALILAALAAMMASGAYGAVRTVNFSPTPVDTADHVVASEVNDTIGPFTSPTISWSGEFTRINGRVVMTGNTDTATATGTSHDSIYCDLQTKLSDNYDSTWHTLWTGTLTAVDEINASGDDMKITVPADSVNYLGDMYRVRYWWIAETDSFQQEANRHAASADSSIIEWGVSLRVIMRFF